MIISQAQPMKKDFSLFLDAQNKSVINKTLREIPQLNAKDKAVFGYIEQKTKQMTIDDLMAKMGIGE